MLSVTVSCGNSLALLSDQELFQGIQAGSEAHFSELYDRYFQRIFAFAVARVHNHADAEEITQDTFTGVFRSLDSYRSQSSLLSWIYGIAKNTINNYHRRNKAQAERLERAEDANMLGPQPSLSSGTPEDQLYLQQCAEKMQERLGKVAAWQAEAFVMRHIEDLSIAEICQRTDRSSDAVRSSLYRVKRLLVDVAVPSAQGTV